MEITITIGNTLDDLNGIVDPFGEAIGVMAVKSIEDGYSIYTNA